MKTPKQRTSVNTPGFSLVEILITMVIIGIGLLAVAQFQGVGLKETNMSQQRVQAVSFGESEIEKIRATINSANDFNNLTAPANADTQDIGNTTYTRNWRVTNTSGGAKRIDMTISWTDREGDNQTVNISSVVSKSTARDEAIVLNTTAIPPVTVSTTSPPSTAATTTTTTAATTTTTTTTTTTQDPDTVKVDTISCECSGGGMGGSAMMGGSHSSSTGYFSGGALKSACDTCCGISSGGGMGMMKPGVSGKITTQGMMGGTTQTCDVYLSGRCVRK